jgi:hypothetical protein
MNKEGVKELELLSVFHYVLGGFVGLCSLFPLLHLFIGVMLLRGGFDETGGEAPPAFIGWFFVIIAVFVMAAGLLSAVCIIIAGNKLRKRKAWMFCMVIAAIECTIFPFGTALGVFTIIILSKDQVKAGFYSHGVGRGYGEYMQKG